MKNTNKKRRGKEQESNPLISLFLLVGPFFTGLIQNYYILFTLALLAFILIPMTAVKKEIYIYKNKSVYLGMGILCLSFFSIFYGISSGDAVYGFSHVLLLALWCLWLMQYEEKERMDALHTIPTAATFMTFLSGILAALPGTSDYVLSSTGRLYGFFQYANSYALFALLGLVIYTKDVLAFAKPKDKKVWMQWMVPVILFAGIVASGSRFTLILTVAVMVALSIKERRVRLPYLGVLGCATLLSGAYVLITHSKAGIGRIFTLFSNSSTLMGRLLYWKDGLRMLLHRPWGMGYYGFFYLQQKEQTGVYTTKFVHNDWLQIGLDFGVIALVCFGILFIIGVMKSQGTRRWVLTIIGIHMVFDLDLQYMIIACIMLLCMDFTSGERMTLVVDAKRREHCKWAFPVLSSIMTVLLLLGVWLGSADAMRAAGDYELSNAFYPWAIETEAYAMVLSEDAQVITDHANHILSEYDGMGVAYDSLALVDEYEGEYLQMVEHKRLAVSYQKYAMDRYDEYIVMLDEAAVRFKENGDTKDYETCISYMEEVVSNLEELKEQTDALSYKTVDAPDFALSDTSEKILASYGILGG